MAETPPNIDEFNQIAALIFAQLYRAFPVVVDIDRGAIAKAMGVSEGDWGKHMLPSGRTFNDVLSGTIGWLEADKYTKAFSGAAFQRVILTTRGLQAMNAVPSPFRETVGTELRKATETSSGVLDLSKIGDLIGGVLGGYTKSLGSG
jgi:hypothetical protein